MGPLPIGIGPLPAMGPLPIAMGPLPIGIGIGPLPMPLSVSDGKRPVGVLPFLARFARMLQNLSTCVLQQVCGNQEIHGVELPFSSKQKIISQDPIAPQKVG